MLLSIFGMALSCSEKHDVVGGNDDVLISVGDSSLTMSTVTAMIPRGLNPDDSTAMFHSIVDGWVRRIVLADVAANNMTDLGKIESMVNQYRDNLIVSKYLATMGENVQDKVTESRIRQYYDAHKEEMLLEEPLIKGAFLKVAHSDESVEKLKRWMQLFTDESIDNIEKNGLRQASQYEYFKDTWHEWSTIAERIPYRFFDADAFLQSTRDFETVENGSLYLLHISAYIPSGQEMPYEYARLKIAEILRSDDINAYRKSLVSKIYRDRIREGKLKPGIYDPVAGKMKDSADKNK